MVSTRPHPRDQRLTWQGERCLLAEVEMLGWDAPRQAGDLGLPPHRHRNALELCCIVDGSVEWWVRTRSGIEIHLVEPGQVFLTRPDEEHGGIDAVLHACELYWVQVRTDDRLLTADMRQLRDGLAEAPRVFGGTDRMVSAFRRLVAEHCAPDQWSIASAGAALQTLLVEALRAAAKDGMGARGVSPAIDAAIRWMRDHLTDDFAIDEAAAAATLSVTQFHERFRREVGYTPGDWRLRQRIILARQLLRDPANSITDVSMRTGFSTSQYFATAFRRLVGLSPRDYRRRSAPINQDDHPSERTVRLRADR